MSYFMIVAVGFLAALSLQFLMQMVQMKSFNKYYTKLRKMGRVALEKQKAVSMPAQSLCLQSIRMALFWTDAL